MFVYACVRTLSKHEFSVTEAKLFSFRFLPASHAIQISNARFLWILQMEITWTIRTSPRKAFCMILELELKCVEFLLCSTLKQRLK